MKFLFKCWKIFHEWAQWTSEIFFQHLCKHQWTAKPFHFYSFFGVKGAIYYAAIATVIFLHVKITCYFHMWSFCAKAHLVFHWCFYNNNYLMSRPDIYGILGADFCLSSDVSSHGFLNALAILPTQVSRIMGALPCLKQNLMSAL